MLKTFKEFIAEDTDHLDLYRRYSTGINKSLIAGDHEGHFSFLKSYDTTGKGDHEYEHHPKKEVLASLDKHTTSKENALKKPTVSYSGVSKEFAKHISDQPHGHTLKTPAYLSSSHDENIARKFAEKDNKGGSHILKFHLPVGFHKSKNIPNAREGGKSSTKERLFARNQEFKHVKTEKSGGITYHHYVPHS
jgi:hypothetical protein